MILFVSNFEDEVFENFSKEFSNNYGIKTKFLLVKELFENTPFSVTCTSNVFSSSIVDVDFSGIKICFSNSLLYVNPADLEYGDKKDTDYAVQEWCAALLALFGIQENTKMITPYLSKYKNESELEHLLLLQRVGLDTVEMLLTNNSIDAIDYYNINEKNLLIKEATVGYAKSRLLKEKQLLNLSKLKLTPCIFQKGTFGKSIEILVLGENSLAIDLEHKNHIKIPVAIKEKLIELCKDCNIRFATFNAIYDINTDKYFFYALNQYPAFSQALEMYGDYFKTLCENFLIKEYNS